MNPQYWDGHTLGVGEAPPYEEEGFQSHRCSDSKFASSALEAVHTHAIVPIKSLYTGDIFNPSEYQPGTVVLYRSEGIVGASVTDDMSVDELTTQAVLDRPTDTWPSFGKLAPTIKIADPKRAYISMPEWGVVPPESDQQYLSACAATAVKSRDGYAVATASFVNEKAPFIIGEVNHWTLDEKREYIRRVNVLHIVAYGVAERQKRRVFSFGGRTAFNGA